MAKALKLMLASQLEQDLGENPGLMLIDPGQMTVETVMAFRRDLREKAGGARLRVIRNRTAKVAFRSMGLADAEAEGGGLPGLLTGPCAVVFGGSGAVGIAKVVREWSRKHKPLKVKAAVAEGEVLLGAEAEGLADMPDLPQLKAMLASAIIGSARGIAISLQSVFGGLARALQAHVDAQGNDAQGNDAQGNDAQGDGEDGGEAQPDAAGDAGIEVPVVEVPGGGETASPPAVDAAVAETGASSDAQGGPGEGAAD